LIRYCPNIKYIKCKYLPSDSEIKELTKCLSLHEEIEGEINDLLNESLHGEVIPMFMDEDENLTDHNHLS
jgi:hypothetical protein